MSLKEVYDIVADVNELKWFFDHIIQKPQINESYTAVFVSRHKKLAKEEQEDIGLTRKEAEFLAVETFRLGHFKDALYQNENNWTFERFLKHLRRLEVNKEAYTTNKGLPLPTKTLATIFYVNPCDNIKVCREFFNQYLDVNQAISKAMLNGKTTVDNLQSYQWFDNAESNLKHLRANQKGTRHYLDFDIDVPAWWKAGNREIHLPEITPETIGPARPEFFDDKIASVNYYEEMKDRLNYYFGKGNYVIVDTSGGYHILVRVSFIKCDPHKFCRDMTALYFYALFCGENAYKDDRGNCKFECIVNDSQIPGLPLPGTYQYNRPVTVLNKEDFE